MTFEQAAVLTLQNSVGCPTSDGVGSYQFYFPELSEQLTEEEIEALLQDEQIQKDAGVGICDYCHNFEYLADMLYNVVQSKNICPTCLGD